MKGDAISRNDKEEKGIRRSLCRSESGILRIHFFALTTFTMKLSLIALLSATALVSAAPFAEPILDERQAAQSINDAMIKKGKKYFGTCADPGRLNSGSNSAIIKANFGAITPENR